MVYKRSEYGHQFKVSSLVKNLPNYKECLNYRHLRRERECSHTPLSWDGETIDCSESDEKLSQDDAVESLPIKELVIKEENEEEGIDKCEGEKKKNFEENKPEGEVFIDQVEREKKKAKAEFTDKQEDELEILQQDDALRKYAKEKLKKYANKDNLDEPTKSKEMLDKKLGKTFVKPKKADDQLFVKRSKPRRPDRVNKIPRARPDSAPTRRPPSRHGARRQPFVNYGSGDSELETGVKKTFNVRASSAVYTAALRAKKRNQLQVEMLQEKQRTASAQEKRRKAKFNEKIARDTASWESEYRRSFSAYESTEYAISDRDPRKKKSFFVK